MLITQKKGWIIALWYHGVELLVLESDDNKEKLA